MKMMLAPIALALTVGCAAGPRQSSTASVAPEPAAEPDLSSAAVYSHLAANANGEASTQVRVCVAPDGTARSVSTVRTSGSELFDNAARTDMAKLRYRPFAAPPTTQVCGNMKLVVSER